MNKLIVNIFLFIIIFHKTYSQEVLTGFNYNNLLNNEHPQKSKTTSIKMPFIDDFSFSYVYPNSNLWQDNKVFINDGFCLSPITIGCATFDALDENGNIYSNASSYFFKADFLTSQPIRLDSIFGTSKRKTSIADSIYLSFFVQPQGLGEAPESGDSLVLEFFNPKIEKWERVWGMEGMSLSDFKKKYGVEFKCIMIPILKEDYLSENFQFRFYNIASLANNNFPTWVGNGDHWNIDYVYLNHSRSINDTFPTDVAFRTRVSTILKNYHSMPWSHYKKNSSNEIKNSIVIPYKNYSSKIINLSEQIIVSDIAGTNGTFNSGLTSDNVEPISEVMFKRQPLPFSLQSDVKENAEFLIKFIINTATIPDMIRSNDTVMFYQLFYNYFAYDDGVPEAGYALVGKNAELAYQFQLNHKDTLQSVQIQFNKTLNSANEELFFTLKVWNDKNGKPGDVIYEEFGLKPHYKDYFGFYTYKLKKPIVVEGKFYVGWQQDESQALNIGFDKTSNCKEKIFYKIEDTWQSTMYDGCLMIRPIVGSKKDAFVEIEENRIQQVTFYPNPVKQNDFIYFSNYNDNTTIEIFGIDGKCLIKSELTNSLQINLPPALYFVRIYDDNIRTVVFQKLIVY